MAGDGGDDKRFPKRPFHGEGEENDNASMNENVKIPPGKKTASGKERRGKENASVLTHCRTSGSTEAKMDQTAVCGSQTRDDPSIFFDEDSNHIFPVEQFFGNMDVVQVRLNRFCYCLFALGTGRCRLQRDNIRFSLFDSFLTL